MLSPPNGGRKMVGSPEGGPAAARSSWPRPRCARHEAWRGAGATRPRRLRGRGHRRGNLLWNPLFSWLLPGEDDGVVAVDRMRVAGMRDLRIVPRSHSFIMNGRDTIALTAAFLKDGAFGAEQAGS